jgi:RasGEF N-terminal motif
MNTVSHDMETTKTSLFDEGMLLLSAIRPPKVPSPVERTTPCVHGLPSSILRHVQQLEACIIELVFLNYWGMTHSSVPQPRPIPPPRLSVIHSFRAPEPVDLEDSSSSSSSSELSTVDGAPISLSSASTPETSEAEQTGPVSRGPGIFTNSDGSVRGGTLEALVEHLTPHDQHGRWSPRHFVEVQSLTPALADFAFHNIFFLTLRSFTTVSEVFPLLVARFNVAPPDDLDPMEQEDWSHKTRHLIRIRLVFYFSRTMNGPI